MTETVSSTIVNLVTPKVGAKHEVFVQQTGLTGGFVERLSQT